MKITRIVLSSCVLFGFMSLSIAATDKQGRKILKGPLPPGTYYKVHIISNTIGVDELLGGTGPVKIINSYIEARICVRSSGAYVTITSSTLNCDMGVEFMGNSIHDNTLTHNKTRGELTNRPDIFGD